VTAATPSPPCRNSRSCARHRHGDARGRDASPPSPAPAPNRRRAISCAGQRVAEGDSLIELNARLRCGALSKQAALTSAQRAYARAVSSGQGGFFRKRTPIRGADLGRRSRAVTSRRAQQLATLRAPLAGVVTAMSAVMGASVDPPSWWSGRPVRLESCSTSRRRGADPRRRRGDGHAGEGAGGEALGERWSTTVCRGRFRVAPRGRARRSAPPRPLRIGEIGVRQIATACTLGRDGAVEAWCRRATAIRSSWWTAPVWHTRGP